MHANHVVVWLDHSEAHVIRFNREESVTELVHAGAHPHVHVKSSGHGHMSEDAEYLEKIVHAIGDAREILVVGPGFERIEFMKYLKAEHPRVAERVLGFEAVDHPSDGALLAYARKYFRNVDRLGLPPGPLSKT